MIAPLLMAATPNPIPDTPPRPSFEAALGELETIVSAMEAGQMPLQDALNAYQRGIGLLSQCQETLKAAEQQIHILDQNVLHDFDPGTNSDEPNT